tara:strand:- start:192 stop:509 length:318 start_codon:yes stop_codon:yes gene_type:complete
MAQVQLVKFIFTRKTDGVIPEEINLYLDYNYVSIHPNTIDGVEYHLGYVNHGASLSTGTSVIESKEDLLTYLNSCDRLIDCDGNTVTASNEADRLWVNTIVAINQ